MGPELSENWAAYAWFLVNIGALDEAKEVILEGEEYSFGADLYYCKAAILFKAEERRTALDALGEALLENYYEAETFFDYLPDFREDHDVKAIIKYYEAEV